MTHLAERSVPYTRHFYEIFQLIILLRMEMNKSRKTFDTYFTFSRLWTANRTLNLTNNRRIETDQLLVEKLCTGLTVQKLTSRKKTYQSALTHQT